MRVLHVYKNYAPTRGGIETYVRQLATSMARRGAEVTVLVVASTRATEFEELAGVRVVRAGRIGEIASAPISVELFRQIRRIDADLIHLHLPYPPGELAALVLARDRPVVVTYHSDVVRQWWAQPLQRPLTRAIVRRAAVVVATSPPYVRTSPILRPIASRCRVVPLGVDLARFPLDPQRIDRSAAPSRREEVDPIVLFVGKFRAYKGLPHLLDAARLVPARFVLVGAGPLEAELRRRVARFDLGEKISFAGEVDDAALVSLYHQAQVVVLPSIRRSEAFGTVLLEAMAAGRPVVSTELGTGTSWVNQHEQTGLVVPPADSAALARALTTLVENPALAARYGDAGRRRVEAELTVELLVERVEQIYEEVMRSRSEAR